MSNTIDYTLAVSSTCSQYDVLRRAFLALGEYNDSRFKQQLNTFLSLIPFPTMSIEKMTGCTWISLLLLRHRWLYVSCSPQCCFYSKGNTYSYHIGRSFFATHYLWTRLSCIHHMQYHVYATHLNNLELTWDQRW